MGGAGGAAGVGVTEVGLSLSMGIAADTAWIGLGLGLGLGLGFGFGFGLGLALGLADLDPRRPARDAREDLLHLRARTVGLVRLGRRLAARDDDDVVERAPGDHLRHEARRDEELGAGVHRRLVSVGGMLQWDWG